MILRCLTKLSRTLGGTTRDLRMIDSQSSFSITHPQGQFKGLSRLSSHSPLRTIRIGRTSDRNQVTGGCEERSDEALRGSFQSLSDSGTFQVVGQDELRFDPSHLADIKPRMRIQFTCTAPSSSSSTHPTHPTTINPTNNLEGKDVTDEIRGDQEDVCGHRNQHEFSRQSFESGIVLVQCPNCLNRHLIADNLQWFTSNPTSDDPNFRMDLRNIVEIMRSKGEVVRRGSSN